MSQVTAKVVCNSKSESGEGAGRQASLGFCPDYADGRNKEWAAATPHLSLSMTVVGPVADLFNQGDRLTLTFTTDEPAVAPVETVECTPEPTPDAAE